MKLTVKEYSSRFNISVQAVYQKLKSGTLKSITMNGTKYVVVERKDIKVLEQPLVKVVEQVSLKYLLKQLKIMDKKIGYLENKINKKDKQIKKLNKKLLQSTSAEKDTLLSFIAELKQFQIKAPAQNYKIDDDIIEVKEPKKKKKKSKNKQKKSKK